MQIITLTTDTGLKDFYHASLKGTLYRLSNQIQIVDISHDITPFDISEAAFQIKSCYQDFPTGTIHIIGVDSEPQLLDPNPFVGNRAMIPSYPSIMKFQGHYFIGIDNGFFGAFLGELFPDEFYRFTAIESHPEMMSFPTKNCLIPLAIKIINNEKLSDFCDPITTYKTAFSQQAVTELNSVQGTVIHVDTYGNLITNISKKEFDKYENVGFKILYYGNSYVIDKISKTYNEVSFGDPVAIFNDNNLLEIAINRGANRGNGGADRLFGVKKGDSVRVNFFPAGSRLDFDSI